MKKSAAKYLSSQELKLFERLYQNIESWPGIKAEGGFKMANLFDANTREHYSIYSQAPRELRPGRKPAKLQVASHESGHAIAMAACHIQVETAKIDMDGSVVTGGIVIPVNLDKSTEIVKDAPLPPWHSIASRMLVDMAGFISEHLYHAEHSYAYHEKLLTYCKCRFLDERNNHEQLHHWSLFVDWCAHLLRINKRLFDAVVFDLLENLSMTSDVRDRLHREVKMGKIELFFIN